MTTFFDFIKKKLMHFVFMNKNWYFVCNLINKMSYYSLLLIRKSTGIKKYLKPFYENVMNFTKRPQIAKSTTH